MASSSRHDSLLPYFSDTEFARNVKEALVTDGYIVVPGVLTRDECATELARLWDFVELTAPGVLRHDPDSW
jgi:hypothetical protein